MLLCTTEDQGKKTISPIWSIGFVALACANGVGIAGMWGLRIAVSWLLWQQTGSVAWLGALGLCDLLPVLAIGFVSGDFVDRTAIQQVLIGAQGLAATTGALLAIMLLLDCTTPIALLAVTVASAAFSICVLTARVTAIGTLVSGADLSRATGVVNLAGHAGLTVGPFLVGWQLASDSAVGSIVVSTSLLAVSALLYRIPRFPVQPDHFGRLPLLQTLQEGSSFVFGHQHLLLVFGAFLLSVLAGRGFHDTLAGYIAETMSGSAAQLGAMVAAGGLGSLAVSLWLILAPPTDHFRPMVAGLCALTSSFIVIAETSSGISCVAGAALLGSGLSLSSAAAQCIALNDAPPALRGRVMGIYTTIWRGGPPLGIITVSLLADCFGFRVIPIILSAAVALLLPPIIVTRRRLTTSTN